MRIMRIKKDSNSFIRMTVFPLLCVGFFFTIPAIGEDFESELEALLTEEEGLTEIQVLDEESNPDLRGRRYVKDAKKLEAEIAADRRIRNRAKRILRFRVPQTESMQDFDNQVSRVKSVGIENIRPQNRVGVRRRQREYLQEKFTQRNPIKVKEFIRIESGDILRSLRRPSYFSAKFNSNRPRNPSASAFTSSVTEPYNHEIETESTRIMRAVFRSGSHVEQLHPGAGIRRPASEN